LDAFKNQFLPALRRLEPDPAASKGYYKYDSLLVIPDAAQRQRAAKLTQTSLFCGSSHKLNERPTPTTLAVTPDPPSGVRCLDL
jgi:hypothetical protein